MKQFLRFKTFLILVLLAMMGQSAWAETETITFSELGLTNGVQYTTPFKSGDVSVTFAGGQNDGKYYTTGEGIRIYANGTMTIEASGKAITAISLTFSGASNAPSSSDVWSSNGSGGGTSGVDASWSGNSTQVVLTRPSVSSHWRLQSVTVTYDAGSSNLTDNDLALTGDPVALSFDLYNNATPQVINYTTSSTGEVTVADNNYATFVVDQTNKTITVTPKAETPSTQSITVIQAADETYAAGSVTFTLDVTDSTPIPTHTATFSVNGTTSTQDFEEGEAIVFPTDPAAIEGKQFVGWVTTEISGTTDTAPSFVSSATMGNSDVVYYAVFATVVGNASDEYMKIHAGSPNIPTSYGTANQFSTIDFYGIDFAVRQMYENGGKLQWRAAGNSNGAGTMYNSTSLGKIRSVVLKYNTGDSNKNFSLKIGSSANPTDGSAITPTIDESIYTFDCSAYNYGYLVLANGSGAGYLDYIEINYTTGTATASEYCTTVQADNRADAELAFSQSSVTLNSNESAQFTAPTLSTATGFDGTVVYSSSNVNVAEVDATTGALQIVGDGTTTITATSAATSSFKAGSASYTLTVFTPLNGIAAFRGLASGNSGTLQLTDAQVLYVNGNDMFVKDATGAIDFYSTGLQYVAGDVLNGTVNAKYTLYKNMPELTTPITDNNLVVTTNSTVTPAEITTSDAANNVCNLVKLTGVTITANGNNFYADNVQIYDKFQLGYTIEAGKIYDIVGIMVPYNSTFELCPTEAPVENTTAIALPTFDVAEGTVAQGTQVTITSEQGTILTYTTDGEDPLTSSTATTTAANTATVTIDATTTIRVVATDGTTFSAEVSATYTVLDPSLVQTTYDFTDATWVANEGYTSAGAVESWAVDNVVIGGDKGEGSTYPTYYNSSNGSNLRTYNNCRFAVASTDGTPITSIVMECSGASYAHVTLPAGQPGNFVLNGTTYTWTPNAGENVVLVTFSGDGTSRISTITVTTKSDVTVTEDVTISAAGFGTLYTEQPFEVPAGMTAGVINAATAADADGISTLTIDWAYAEGTIVPPATPLLIKGDANTYTYTCKGTTAATPEANLLHGSAVATTTTGGANDVFYMLSYGKNEKANVLGFFYGAPNGGAFESAAGKCWLAVAVSSGIRGFVFGGDDDITTGISAVRTAIANGQAVYDLQGRRVENASRGVYIIGGKKVMVK